jgi:hypothetical protein
LLFIVGIGLAVLRRIKNVVQLFLRVAVMEISTGMEMKMSRELRGFVGLVTLTVVSLSTQAGFVNNVDIGGNFDVYNFNPLLDDDADPFTYTLDLFNVTGRAEFNVPPIGTNLNWTASGAVALAQPNGNIPTLPGSVPPLPWAFNDLAIASGPFNIQGFTQQNYIYDFDTQTYTSTSGGFITPLPGGPGVLSVAYDILDLDSGGLVNDIRISLIESGFVDPAQTVSALLNFLDLPVPFGGFGGNGDGHIRGTFDIDATVTGVPEPTSVALLGLGLLGLGFQQRKKMQTNKP